MWVLLKVALTWDPPFAHFHLTSLLGQFLSGFEGEDTVEIYMSCAPWSTAGCADCLAGIWPLSWVIFTLQASASFSFRTFMVTAPWQTTPDMNQSHITELPPVLSVFPFPVCPLWLFSVPFCDVHRPQAFSYLPKVTSFVYLLFAECSGIFSQLPRT